MKTAIITGASTGLGLECARALLRRDAWRIVLAVRDPARRAEQWSSWAHRSDAP